jgi:hypothetical protein
VAGSRYATELIKTVVPCEQVQKDAGNKNISQLGRHGDTALQTSCREEVKWKAVCDPLTRSPPLSRTSLKDLPVAAYTELLSEARKTILFAQVWK